MRLPILAVLLLTGCHTAPKRHDTAILTAKLGEARSGVEAAQRSTEALAGHVGAARGISSRIDNKSTVVLKWLNR